MLRATLKSLAARKLRLVLTATAIVFGVTFVTGTLVLTDTSTRLFDNQFTQATAGVDLVVRDAATFGAAMGVEVQRDPVTSATLERIRATEGVGAAQGIVRGSALLVVDGEPVIPAGASIGQSWAPEPFNVFRIRTGRPPAGTGELVVDHATAVGVGVGVGDQVRISLEDGAHNFEVVGTAGFGDADGIPNATIALFNPDEAQHLYGMADGWSEVQIVVDGATPQTVRESLSASLGDRFDIETSQDTAAASAAAAQQQLLYLRVMLLALAATSLVVGAFMIANTFSIVVAQRTHEFATLRALGASRRQVLASVLAEAVVVATAASAVGVGLGVAAATGLRAVSRAFGVVVPSGPLAVEPATLGIGMAVGVAVTLVSAAVPARRAARTSPVAALRQRSGVTRRLSRRRLIIGGLLAVSGVGASLVGALGGELPNVGLGSVITLIATVILAPAFAGPLAARVGRVAGRDVVVRLARTNVRRAGRRTAATSMALAVGLAVVTFMTVVATSAKAGIGRGLDDVVRAELIVQSARGEMLGGLSPHAHHHASEVPGVELASRMRFGHWQSQGRTEALTAIDPQTFPAVADLTMVEGDLDALRTGGILIAENVAERRGLDVGDHLPMRFSQTGDQQLEIVGIFDADDTWAVSTGYLISLETFAAHFAENVDASVFLDVADDADLDAVRADVEAALADFPTAAVHDQAGATAARTRMLDSLLGLVTVLLLLAIVIALLGITNALALAIVERTREVGMLRAVGTTRRQIGWMVRAEAALTAVVGALVGTALGLGFAAAVVKAMGGSTAIPLTIPAIQLLSYLLVATLGGVVAGLLPGRRASRMDVLAAVVTE